MIEIYSWSNQLDKAESFLKHPDFTVEWFNIILCALGKRNQASRATSILKNLLQRDEPKQSLLDSTGTVRSSNVDPNPLPINIQTFTTVLHAWARSLRESAVAEAHGVFKLLKEHPKCLEMGIRPNTITYNTLLKCISHSKEKIAGKIAVRVLNEMEQLEQTGNKEVAPCVQSYTLAITACLQNNPDLAETLMKRMNKRGIAPNIVTYNVILKYWSRQQSRRAAERAEQILSELKTLAQTNPQVTPDVFTYNTVITAWIQAGSTQSTKGVKRVYDQMISDNVKPNFAVLSQIIAFLSKSYQVEMIQEADNLLRFMECSNDPGLNPNHIFFTNVFRGWLSVGDLDRATLVLMRSAESFVVQKNRTAIKNARNFEQIIDKFVCKGEPLKAWTMVKKLVAFQDNNVLPFGPSYDTLVFLLRKLKRSLDTTDFSSEIQELEKLIISRTEK
jgi:hypothetical protein